MWFRRLFFLLGIAFSAVCYVLTERMVFALLALVMFILPWFGLILIFIASHGIEVKISAMDHAQKNETVHVDISMRGSAFLSIVHVQIQSQIFNLLTGENTLFKLSGSTGLTLQSAHCGKLSVKIERIILMDPLKLFRRRCRTDILTDILILPETFEPVIEVSASHAPDIESDEYSVLQSGTDPSELIGIRDYCAGDSLRSIHWKLSEKYDRTVVKEMSQPTSRSLLLLFDNCPTSAFSAESVDLVFDALMSISQTLADLSVSHRIAWFNRETGLIDAVSIATLDDLAGEQGRLLSARVILDSEGIVPRLLEEEMLSAVQHVLLFAPVQPEHVNALGEDVTVLLPQTDPSEGISCLPEYLTRLIV